MSNAEDILGIAKPPEPDPFVTVANYDPVTHDLTKIRSIRQSELNLLKEPWVYLPKLDKAYLKSHHAPGGQLTERSTPLPPPDTSIGYREERRRAYDRSGLGLGDVLDAILSELDPDTLGPRLKDVILRRQEIKAAIPKTPTEIKP